jgi:hypothetical protein
MANNIGKTVDELNTEQRHTLRNIEAGIKIWTQLAALKNTVETKQKLQEVVQRKQKFYQDQNLPLTSAA